MIKCPRAVLSTSRELSALHPWTPVSNSNPLLQQHSCPGAPNHPVHWCCEHRLKLDVLLLSLLFGSQLKVRSSYRQPCAATDRE